MLNNTKPLEPLEPLCAHLRTNVPSMGTLITSLISKCRLPKPVRPCSCNTLRRPEYNKMLLRTPEFQMHLICDHIAPKCRKYEHATQIRSAKIACADHQPHEGDGSAAKGPTGTANHGSTKTQFVMNPWLETYLGAIAHPLRGVSQNKLDI